MPFLFNGIEKAGCGMKDQKYKADFEEICRHWGLGELVKQPMPISGGLMHRMYMVETTGGKYAVKLLNPSIMERETAMQNYINSEKIAHLISKEISALPAEKKEGKTVQESNGQYYLVFRWIEGRTLKQEEIKVNHCKQMGGTLAIIHQTDFSDLEIRRGDLISERVPDWKSYLKGGEEKGAEWTKILNEHIQKLEKWSMETAESVHYLSCDNVLSHRDLDSKNVMWHLGCPVIIDWESAGFIHPMQDLLETAIYWSNEGTGRLNRDRFFSFINGYKEKKGEIAADWGMVAASGFSGKLNWLEYSLKRSLNIECTDAEERKMGTAQVSGTIREIKDFANQIPVLTDWLANLSQSSPY